MAKSFRRSIKQIQKVGSTVSLLSDALEPCQILNKITEADGYGGYRTVWTAGALFDGAIVLNSSLEAQTALAAGVTGIYTVTTRRVLNLQYHDVFKRLSDGKIFRVTSDGDDSKTPKSATLDMRNVTAEEWTLPDE